MPKDQKIDKIGATRILATVNRFYMELFPLFTRERMLVNFYNGGVVPCEDEDEYEDSPVSLGLGYRYIKKPFDGLLDTLIMEPGFIQSDLCYPINPQRKGKVQSAVDKEANAIVQKRMESAIRKCAGRAVIVGRAFMFRLSRWDWLFKTGRMLHAVTDTDDVYSEGFREWAFAGEITLRQLDQYLDSTRKYDGAGWNREGMAALKKWILLSTRRDQPYPEMEIDRDLLVPFNYEMSWRPLLVYWYFRKNGTKNDRGDERVDLYCVSRWGQQNTIEVLPGDGGVTYQRLNVKQTVDKDKHPGDEQILYYLPNAFENIEECLLPILLDSRVDGEQELAQVDGTGKIMLPRIQFMENIALSVGEGVSWGVQPNWTSATGAAVDENKLRLLQKNGVGSWDYIPPGLQVMNKQGSLTGLNAGMAVLQMLGMSVENDAGTGDLSPMGQADQPRFKAQMDMLISMANQAVSRRGARFFSALDDLAEQQLSTLCRPISQWRKGDAAYHDVKNFQTALFLKYQILPPEYDPNRMDGKCRRLMNDQNKQEAVQTGVFMLNQFGNLMSPQGRMGIAKNVSRAVYGDAMADFQYPDQEQVQPDQQATALSQTYAAILSFQPPPRQPGDNPQIHMQIHLPILQQQLQAAQQQGSITPAQQAGLAAILQHMVGTPQAPGDFYGLPPQIQQQVGPVLKQLGMLIQKLPVMGAQTELGLKAQQLQLQQHAQGTKDALAQNLMQDRNAKLQTKQAQLGLQQNQLGFDQQIRLRDFLLKQRAQGVDEAAQLLDMLNSGEEMPDTPAPATTS